MPDRPLRASLWPAFAWSWPGRHMQRREFITLLGGTVAWPFAARAQQRRPVIGFLGTVAEGLWAKPVAAFEERLREHGWIDGRTIKIIYRWAEGRPEGCTPSIRQARSKVPSSCVAVTCGEQGPNAMLQHACPTNERSLRSRGAEGPAELCCVVGERSIPSAPTQLHYPSLN